MVFTIKCFLPVVHNLQVENFKVSLMNGALRIPPAFHITHSPTVWPKMLSNKPRTCFGGVRRKVLIPFLTSLICLKFLEMKHKVLLPTPVAKQLLTPKAASSRIVASRRKWKRQQQKAYYNQHVKYLSLHHPKWVVRLHTEKSREKVGIVKTPAAQQGPYIVQTEEKECRWNQGHLLAILKPIPSQSAAQTSPHLPTVPQHPPIESNAHQPPTMSNEDILPEATGPVNTPAKKPAEPAVSQRSPTRKFIGPQAQLKPFLGGVMPEAACSNVLPSSNAPRP